MSNPTNHPAAEPDLALARAEVIAWLRDGAINNDPMFMLGHPEEVLRQEHGEIADRFLKVVAPAGFDLEVFPVEHDGLAAFDSRWTHRAADFVGFKNPRPAALLDDARLLACAALLRNEWCRQRLETGAG